MTTTSALFQEPQAQPDAPQDLDTPTAEAPYGYTRDPETGVVRPKKTAGRRARNAPPPKPAGVPPTIEELKAAAADKPEKGEDRPPAPAPKSRARSKGPKMSAPPEPVRPFRAGPIAKSVNRIYKRAGKIIRTWDPEVGNAIIVCATKEDEDDVTVGEAWEELARVNPRVRAFLEKMISGGAVGSLIAAHMPIVLAFLMKDAVRSKIPMMGLVSTLLEPDDDAAAGDASGGLGAMLGGIGPDDMAQMMQFAQGLMGPMMAGMPRDPGGTPRDPGPVVDQDGRAVA